MCLFVCPSMGKCGYVHVFVSVELWDWREALRRYIAAFGVHEYQIIYPTPMLQVITLFYSSLPSAYEVIQHVPLSFALPLLCVSMSLHASMSAALPTGVWFMNPILVCHYCLQKGALMDQYVESVTRRIASCPQTSWIFFWQPVACSISDLDDTLEDDILRCYKKFWVISFCR